MSGGAKQERGSEVRGRLVLAAKEMKILLLCWHAGMMFCFE